MKLKCFTKNAMNLCVLLPLLFSLSGCVYLIVGGVGAFGGYYASPDSIEGLTEVEEIVVWDTAVEIISIMGTIKEQNEDSGIILARVNATNVTVTISTISETVTQINVKARKAFLPKMNVAQSVFVKIMSNL